MKETQRRDHALRRGAAIGEGLTQREHRILALVVEGLTNREIAERLNFSEAVIKRALEDMKSRLHCRNRTDLAVRALKAGWLQTARADREEPTLLVSKADLVSAVAEAHIPALIVDRILASSALREEPSRTANGALGSEDRLSAATFAPALASSPLLSWAKATVGDDTTEVGA